MDSVNMKNPKSRNLTDYVDVDIQIVEKDENGNETLSDWMPHTIRNDDPRYADIVAGSLGPVVEEAPLRDVPRKYSEVLAQGVEWNDGASVRRLKADNVNERDRILSASIRLSINNTLPKNKTTLEYPDIYNVPVVLLKEQVQEAAMRIQDFVEDVRDNYVRLMSDSSLDVNTGWPTGNMS